MSISETQAASDPAGSATHSADALPSLDDHQATRVALSTVYLQYPVQQFHQIALFGTLGGTGSLWLDANRCRVNHFGDREHCSEIAPVERRVRLIRTRDADPLHLGRARYIIAGAMSNQLHLIVPHDNGPHDHGEPYRFVYEDRSLLSPRPITLERLVWHGGHEPATDSTAPAVASAATHAAAPAGTASATRLMGWEYCFADHYSAYQMPDGRVSITAIGWHSRSGYRVLFEELPGHYPPEFRLLHFKPLITGPRPEDFTARTEFMSDVTLDQVTVYDAHGRHKVPVDQPAADARSS